MGFPISHYHTMKYPQLPKNENKRLQNVKNFLLLDTLPEAIYDDVTALIADICNVPISLITLLDEERNFLKSHHGVPFNESPRNISFCGHAILEETPLFIIEDATKDNRFHDNPLVTEHKAQFYAGAPLISPSGYKLGTLCVFDTKPRELSESQKNVIIKMAQQVVKLFELHKKNIELTAFDKELKARNERLKSFAGVVSHDLKSPLANITSLTQLLRNEYQDTLKGDGLTYLSYIEESSESLRNYIEGMLKFYKSEALTDTKPETIFLSSITNEVEELFHHKNVIISFPKSNIVITTYKMALIQILLNLISNGIKYNQNPYPKIDVSFKEDTIFYYFDVQDNGIGIEKAKQKRVFELFETAGQLDSKGKKGTGIGLATVKTLIEKMGGSISLSSVEGKGSTFSFTIKK